MKVTILPAKLCPDDLYETEGLSRLDQAFLSDLAAGDARLAERLEAARRAPEALDRKAESALLLELAGPLDAFIGRLVFLNPAGVVVEERWIFHKAAEGLSGRIKEG